MFGAKKDVHLQIMEAYSAGFKLPEPDDNCTRYAAAQLRQQAGQAEQQEAAYRQYIADEHRRLITEIRRDERMRLIADAYFPYPHNAVFATMDIRDIDPVLLDTLMANSKPKQSNQPVTEDVRMSTKPFEINHTPPARRAFVKGDFVLCTNSNFEYVGIVTQSESNQGRVNVVIVDINFTNPSEGRSYSLKRGTALAGYTATGFTLLDQATLTVHTGG